MGERAKAVNDSNVQSLERALIILEALAQNSGGLGVTELSQRVGLHKSTVYRLLSTLESRGFVEQDVYSERYKIGLKVIELGLTVLNNLDLRREALPYLQELVEVSREMVQLAVLDAHEVVVLERQCYPGEIVTLNLGWRLPVHCTATGKVLLAGLRRAEVVEIIRRQGLTPYTTHTITDMDRFLSSLEKVRSQGYAISAEEYAEGVRDVAGPVYDHLGRLVAAVGIVGPSSRLTLERVGRLIIVLKETCASISTRLGYGAGK